MHNNVSSEFSLTERQGRALVMLARHAIAEQLGVVAKAVDDATGEQVAATLVDPDLQQQGATFVTLTVHGRLRGCIGSLRAVESVVASVRNNAVNAAFGDPRFPPLAADELATVDVEVSILSDPQPLAYTGGDDLAAKLRPHVDGVIISRGSACATFLPQVWEQLPHPHDFLNHLCLKAMLPMDAWRSGTLEVQTYTVQHFREGQ
ncbi:MAG: AmmeMemoRadiSam system protein A [Desulfobulbaceae bacterium]|nr:AmmeMemoRadiSam system protein A [Desulfobulbaceae bacterium]